ncbi:unnamed protein product, partial [Rotaria socialis]
RAIRYCSTFQSYLNEREKLRMALLLNKYPNKIIDEQFDNVLFYRGIGLSFVEGLVLNSIIGIDEPLTLTNYNRSRQKIIDSPSKDKLLVNYEKSIFVHFTYCSNNMSIDHHGFKIRQCIQEQRWIRRFSLKIRPFTQQPNSVPERTNEDMGSK